MLTSLASRPLAAFPVFRAGRLPHHSFRGLRSVHIVAARVVAEPPRAVLIVGVLQPMSLPPSSAPTATGWSDSCRAGFAPAEEWRLSRRTGMPRYWTLAVFAVVALSVLCGRSPAVFAAAVGPPLGGQEQLRIPSDPELEGYTSAEMEALIEQWAQKVMRFAVFDNCEPIEVRVDGNMFFQPERGRVVNLWDELGVCAVERRGLDRWDAKRRLAAWGSTVPSP